MLYRPDTQTAIPTITGRNLAHADRTAVERALVGAGLHLNRIPLVSPTIKQCAGLVDVCVPYVAAAVAIVDDQALRRAVHAHEMTLLEAAALHSEDLADHILRSTPKQRLEASRKVGPAVIWDTMIAPVV